MRNICAIFAFLNTSGGKNRPGLVNILTIGVLSKLGNKSHSGNSPDKRVLHFFLLAR
jgi:hypothetical protein